MIQTQTTNHLTNQKIVRERKQNMSHQILAHLQCINLIVILVCESTIIWPSSKHLLMLIYSNCLCIPCQCPTLWHCGPSDISTISQDDKEKITRCNVFLHKSSQDAIFQTCWVYLRHTLPQ